VWVFAGPAHKWLIVPRRRARSRSGIRIIYTIAEVPF
jgi:hypothetical protein